MMTRWFNSLPYVSPIVNEFIITVKTDNAGVSASNEILLPIQGTNMVIDWGDGSTSVHTQELAPNNTIGGNNVTHTYSSAGVYQIKISPSITRIYFNNGGDRLKLLLIENWGKAIWSSFQGAYYNCQELNVLAVDTPNFSQISSNFSTAFTDCRGMTTIDVKNWNMENITIYAFSFQNCRVLQKLEVDNWNVSNVESFAAAFVNCFDLNELNVLNWDVSNVLNFSQFLAFANTLNQSLETFNLNPLVNLTAMLNVTNSTIGTNFQEAYSRTLIGWANNIFSRGGVVTGRSLGANNRRYNNINYVSGQQFNNAVDARDYLVNTLGWTITGDAQV